MRPKSGYKISEEHKIKIGLANKGKKRTQEAKNKMSEKAKKPERIKIAIQNLPKDLKGENSPNWHKKKSRETRRKISETLKANPVRYWLGKKFPEEYRKKLSESHKGIEQTKETREKISLALRGENSYLWQGGISKEPYSVDWTRTLKRAIRERDNYICQICSQYGEIVHHIDYNKKNCCPENLIILCHSCHSKTNNNRNYWINYFK